MFVFFTFSIKQSFYFKAYLYGFKGFIVYLCIKKLKHNRAIKIENTCKAQFSTNTLKYSEYILMDYFSRVDIKHWERKHFGEEGEGGGICCYFYL